MPALIPALTRPFDSYDSYDGSTYGDSSAEAASVFLVIMAIMGVYALIFLVIWLANGFAWAGLFGKAGYPQWAAFVPFYNTWIMVKIAGRPESHFWLQFIPYAGIYWAILTVNDLAKSFGKDTAYTVGLLFLPVVFASILSYGQARYLGPAYAPANQYPQPYGQPHMDQPYAGQPYGQQPHPGQHQSTQPYPAQPFPEQANPAQPSGPSPQAGPTKLP